MDHSIKVVDPQGNDAMALLKDAAIEARALYQPEASAGEVRWPTNPPTPPRGTYLVAYVADVPIACGALRPIDGNTVEIRRMYVAKRARRRGIARAMLAALERVAGDLDYEVMQLETGNRQAAAIALYESCGFRRIPAFGDYVHDPTSVCFEKSIASAAS